MSAHSGLRAERKSNANKSRIKTKLLNFDLSHCRRGLSLEITVDRNAVAALILGVIGSCGLVLTFSLWGAPAAVVTMSASFVVWLLLRCLAEHLRLQKKIAGLHFQGEITGPRVETIWYCGSCDQMLHSESRCDACGVQIVAENGTLMGNAT